MFSSVLNSIRSFIFYWNRPFYTGNIYSYEEIAGQKVKGKRVNHFVCKEDNFQSIEKEYINKITREEIKVNIRIPVCNDILVNVIYQDSDKKVNHYELSPKYNLVDGKMFISAEHMFYENTDKYERIVRNEISKYFQKNKLNMRDFVLEE
ncbi:hypothetical protein EHQ94_11145 [Leptospira meyeri]|uniref:hypothetical protein n=1 Tax=Leptospira meyeri TaxID=29508 RepID=UPI0010833E2D|nr:hypothetical protein [Leptospira meyeri]TGM66144.1 hypothetical protein EHQ94_11145 [Leptospira meyeri]